MQAVNAHSSIDSSCSLCLAPTIPRPVGEVLIRGCCKQLVHASCWKRWEDQPGSRVSFQGLQGRTSDTRLTFRRCSLCQQNAVPLIHLSTVAYKNSSLSYCRDGETKTLLRQLVSEAGGATDDALVTEGARTAASPSSEKSVHALLLKDMHIPTLAELVEGEMNSTDTGSDFYIPPRYRPNEPAVRSSCVEPFLLQACQTGDPELIRAIVSTHPNAAHQLIYSVSHKRRLPMAFVAADNGHVEAVSILGTQSSSAFYKSVSISLDDGNLRALRTLVSAAQADSPELFSQIFRKVQSAVTSENQVALAQLFSAGTRVDKIVSLALENHSPLVVSVIYEAGIRKDEILFQVASHNASALLTELMITDADSVASDSALAATVLAASEEDIPALKVLVSCGVQLNHALLHAARYNAGKPAIATLINNGADVHLALSEAVNLSEADDLNDDLLITNLLSSLDMDQAVLLLPAAERGDLQTINKLLKAGANPNAGCENGNPLTPLFIAAGNGHEEIVNAIFTFTGDPGYRPTMIYHAALESDEQTLRCLMKVCNSQDQRITDMACVLQKAVNDKDYGRLALERIMQINPVEVGRVMMKLINDGDAQTLAGLLQHGASANFNYITGWSLLHGAASKGEPELVKLLLDHGAAVHQLTDTGASALSVAAGLGNKPVVSTLVKARGCPDINSAISTALEQHDHDTLGHLIAVADTDGPAFRQLLMCAARCDNVDAIKTMVQSRHNSVSADIAFFQAFNDGDPKLTQSFLKAGVGLTGPSATSFLLMTAIRGNAEMVAAITRHWTNIVDDMYQAATAREFEAFTALIRAFNDGNKNSDELIAELIDKAITDKNQNVFDVLISAEQQTGIINIGKYLVSALQIRSDGLDELNVAQQHMAKAVNDRTLHDQELAMNIDGEDDFVDDTSQSSAIERRIAEHASTIKTCQMTVQGIDWAIKASVKSGAQRVITVESAQIILTLAVTTCCPALVKMVLDSWSDPGLITDETRNVITGALLQAIEAQKWDMVRLLTGTAPIDCEVLNAKRTLLYEVAQSQDIELLGALWRLGVRAAPSVHCALTDKNPQCLQHFIDAGITLDDNDNDVDLHPLVAAVQISADQGSFATVRSLLSITKNVDTVLYKHALLNHKHVISVIWDCSGRQHELIISVVRKAVTTANSTNNSSQVINTLRQIECMAPQLSQCLFEAARAGEREVALALIACNIDIHDPTYNPAFFLYLSACADLQLAATILSVWKSKANRNTPILIKQACDIAKREQGEGSHEICDFLNGWLLTQVNQSSERAAAYVEKQKQQSQNSQP